MTRAWIVAIAISVEIVLLGYGVYALVDRGPWALLLVAVAVSIFLCLRGRLHPFPAVALHAALVISVVSAWAVTRGAEAAIVSFGPGAMIMFLGSRVFYSQSYDPVGHPLLWGLAIVANTAAWCALIWLAVFIGRKRYPLSPNDRAT